MKQLVFFESNQALTTSLIVAEHFEKRHDHVIRDIEAIIEQMASERQTPKSGNAQMFIKTTYQAETGGRKYPMYLMNRDGFALLAMGFTGAKAFQFKLAFLDAFNKMEDTLKKLGAAEVQRLQLRQAGKEIGRKPVTEAIHLLNQRDFRDGDKDPRGRKRYAAYTFKTQIKTLGIPKGGRDAADGAQLAALTLGEKNSAAILNHALDTGGSYLQAEAVAINLFQQLRHLSDGQYSKLQLKEDTK